MEPRMLLRIIALIAFIPAFAFAQIQDQPAGHGLNGVQLLCVRNDGSLTAQTDTNADWSNCVTDAYGRMITVSGAAGGSGDFGAQMGITPLKVGTDTAETLSTVTNIVATAHAARVNDYVLFTAGTAANIGVWRRVLTVATDSFTLATALPATPANGDAFTIYRPTPDSSIYAEDSAHVSTDLGQAVFGIVNSNAATLAAGEQDYVNFALGNKGTVFPDLNTDFRQSTLRSPMKPEDEAFADTSALMMAGAVVDDNTPTPLSATEGDAVPLRTSSVSGALFVSINQAYQSSAGGGLLNLEDAASASGDAGVVMLAQMTSSGTAASSATNGDYVTFKQDIDGRLNVNPFGSNVDGFWQACSASNTGTSDTAIKAAVASNRMYVTNISCFNTATVASAMAFKDGATQIYVGGISNSTLAGVAYWEHTFGIPLRGSVNTAFNFAMATNATATTCCATGFTSVN